MQSKWTPGKVVALIFGCIGAGVVLLISLYISIFQMSALILFFGREPSVDYSYGEEAESIVPHEDYAEESEKGKEKEEEGTPWSGNEQYYDFHDEIRTNLSYQIMKESVEETTDEYGMTWISGNYPVVSCEDPNKQERINRTIQEEIDEIFEYVTQIGEDLPESSFFIFEVGSYVTYMDDDVLSVIFEEYGYLDDEMYESYIVSMNFDMESGMPMTNSQILDIDDEFSIDFRKRNEKQNGQVQGLDYYSDQDITEMLNDDDSLIIFYTPLGMEVGINYYFGWVTVTYKDYVKFSNHF